jgi:DNA-binding NarL/FixJ family response regulator
MEYSLLIVSPNPGDVNEIRLALADYEFAPVAHADSYHEALRMLGKRRFSLILCDAGLSRTCWKDLLSQISLFTDPPPMVLMAPLEPESLWAEAISLGVRDMLAKPLDDDEIQRIVVAAMPAAMKQSALTV